MAKTYNSYGGDPRIAMIPSFLLSGAPDFGPALRELDVLFHWPTHGPPRPSLERLYANHQGYRRTLPKLQFQRSRESLWIHVASDLFDGNDSPGFRDSSCSPACFTAIVDEVLAALELLRTKLKASDDFDLDGFLAHCNQARGRIPTSQEGLDSLVADLRAVDKARREALSEWDKLDIEWRDFHPSSRALLDDPFFWDPSNDFAPHGNDTGADLLADYQEWHKSEPTGDSLEFLEELMKRWGYESLDEVTESIRDESLVGLAFAELKSRGLCGPEVKALALEGIARQRAEALGLPEWRHQADRLESLKVLEQKLQ